MPVAFNPDTNEARYLDDAGSWQPAQTAVHPQTNQRVIFDGKSWVDWAPQKPQTSATDAYVRGLTNAASFNFLDELSGIERAGANDRTKWSESGFETLGNLGRGAYRKFISGDPEAQKAYETEVARMRGETAAMREQHPVASIAGEVTGSLAAPGMAAARGATMASRIGRGAIAGAGYGALAGAGEGTTPAERGTQALIGGGTGAVVGAVAPPIVEGAIQAGSHLLQPIASRVRGAINPEAEAARRVTTAIGRDIQSDPNAVSRLTPQEFAAASQPGGPATVLDLGGETTRALARSAANTSPEGRAALQRTIDDRFEGQSGRVIQWLRHEFNFPDAYAQQQAIDQAQRATNSAAYRQAYRDGAGGLWSPGLERLAGSDAVTAAMQAAAKSAKDEAIIGGYGAMNPRITFTPDGRIQFNRGPNGVPTYPDLQYWDLVRRELGDAARRAGYGTTESRRLGNFATALNAELDSLVPSYANARSGAARFFGAENALEAGQNFVGARTGTNEQRAALARMSPLERQLFQDGYVSRMIERLSAASDRRNIVNQLAQNPLEREKLNMALGPQRAAQLEAGLRVEGVMDLARGATQGNSTTIRQLVELGLAGGAGGLGGHGIYTTDPREMGAAALTGALLAGRRHIDHRVARRVAEMLTSQDPTRLAQGLNIIARSNRLLDALRTADQRLAIAGSEQAGRIPALQATGVGRAQEPQQGVPGPPNQQKYGGRIPQKQGFAHGGRVVRLWHPVQVGARRARDGRWYVSDPDRGPDKYLLVENRARRASNGR